MAKIKLFLSLCLPYKWRGGSEIIVGDEPPCFFENTLLQKGEGVTPHSEIIVGDERPCIF